ncbi:hypothetical protein PhaeoP18_02885 [Phaeobacter piscinae]|uniref:hypothetical protein n=1 Tax=Phaeobacter piscinae TaxID=1580596 RepID=UPI000C9CBEE8|nr:hypothetical protein [Phaeobacter piscinae]AUR37121.1 hypothetical protein PhaeoP18_02885 [Phaeobacter piscinae]
MKSLIFFLVSPLVLGLIAFKLKPEIFLGSSALDVQGGWSFVGIFLGYVGCVLSSYAAFEVRRLSDRYFAKQRLPQLRKQAGQITDKMDELKEMKLVEVRAHGFLGEVRVLVKQLEKTRSPGFPEVVKRTKRYCTEVEKRVKNCSDENLAVNDVGEFWDLYTSLTEVSDEIHAYEQEVKASL